MTRKNVQRRLPKQPNPGSIEAIEKGCRCPVIDNHYGRGVDDKGGVFWYTSDCPIHGYEGKQFNGKTLA